MEGQVTIYTIAGCPHCLHAKQTLKNLKINYFEVSVNKNPDVREWLKEKTGKTSLPQIFFNDTHIGGNDNLQAIVKDEKRLEEILDILKQKYNSNLLIPTSTDEDASDKTSFTCSLDPHFDVVRDLVNAEIPHSARLSIFSRKLDGVLSGADFVKWFCNTKDSNEEESIKMGSQLLETKFLVPLTNSSLQLVNDSKVFYRLTESSDVSTLNAGPTDNCKIPNGNELAEILRNSTLQLYSSFVSQDGKKVEYGKMKNSKDFAEYVNLSRYLQRVPVEEMNDSERKAFFINIYNAMVIHATTLAGPPVGFIKRYKFFADTKYIIGGLVYSLNDIENGVLRGNKRSALSLFRPFGKHDKRRAVELQKVDPRIHFALNCGAKSCPPIKTFTAEDINAELQLATESYLEEDEGITISESDAGVANVMLSSLFRWYASDFGASMPEVLIWIKENLSLGEKKNLLTAVLEKIIYKVSYLPYDWESNALE